MQALSIASVTLLALVGCSKSASEKTEAPPAGSDKAPVVTIDAAVEPTESAAVVGPTRSATGSLEFAGAINGTFEWKKKDQKSPISCAWDPAKEIGAVHVDLSDGAGKVITLGIDVPPTELGLARLDVTSKDLAAPLKSSFGFNVSGEDASLITVKFDTKLGDDENKPDLTIKGTLEVTCPKKK